jgi:DNA-binding PadR family transcriptional regulator
MPVNDESLNATAAVLLGILQLGPAPATEGYGDSDAMTGWQLHQSVRASVGAFWNITRSQIYVELERLATKGLVDELGDRGPRRQRRYEITPRGSEAFDAWITGFASDEAKPDALRSPLALLVFFGERLPPALLQRALLEHRLVRERRLEQLGPMKNALSPDDKRRLPTAVLERGVRLHELHVRWIEEVLEMLGENP